jgi:serralysin
MPNPSTGTPALLVTQPFQDFYGLGVNVVDSLRAGSKWGTTTLTYSFPATIGSTWAASYGDGEPSSQKFRGLTLTEQDAAKAVIAQWATVANLRLTQTVDTAQEVGTFRFAFTDTDMGPTTTAYSYLPSTNVVGGDTWLNTDHSSLQGSWAAGTSAFQTLLHEFGHSLGLKHPFVSSATGGPAAPIEYQARSATVMAYESEPTLGQGGQTGFTFEPTTPMRLDILAIQQLYGANSAWNSTSTTYTFGGADLYHQTIWDAGGSDDRIVYNAVTDGDIDLRPGYSSRLGAPVYTRWNGSQSTINQVDNIWIAYGVDIENADGGSGNDLIHGNTLANELNGGAGDDTLFGDAGDDRFDWAADLRGGNDTMYGGTGDDEYVIFGNDTVVELANQGTDTIFTESDYSLESIAHVENLSYFGSGGATLRGNGLGNQLFGNAAGDQLFGLDGNDVLNGLGGADTLVGGSGNNTLDGGSGTDTAQYAATAGEVIVNLATGTASRNGTGGADVLIDIENVTGNDLGNILIGNGFDNVLTGGAGADTLSGGAGNDRLVSLGGADTLLGGSGNDTYEVLDRAASIVEAIGEGSDTVRTPFDIFVLPGNVENLVYLGSAAFLGIGNELGNTISGGTQRDELHGYGGDDVLNPGSGSANTALGGDGNDSYNIEASGDSIVETLNGGYDTVNTALTTMTLAPHVEKLVFTGQGNFVGSGNAADNLLVGGTGLDVLIGHGGNDTLVSNGGSDELIGGLGDDVYQVLSRAVSIIEFVGQGSDRIETPASIYVLNAQVENLSFTGSGSFLGIGNELANVLRGGTGADDLYGREGSDWFYGGTGAANTLLGGSGDDAYVVEAAGESIVEALADGWDSVFAHISSFRLPANVEFLWYHGSGAFLGLGNELDNYLTGRGGADVLQGLAGNDLLTGGSGADELSGGSGADRFQYVGGEIGIDTIVDFKPGEDKILVSSGFYPVTPQFSLVQGSAPLLTSANSTFIYNSSTGIVSFDADGTGVAAAVSLASIGAGKILQIADFGYSSGTIRPLQATEPGGDDGAHARARAASAEFLRAGSGNDWLAVEEGDLVQAVSVSHQGDAGWLL